MPFAVTLRLDADSAARVEAIVAALADRGISTSMRRLGYPPHLALAVCDDKADQTALIQAVRRTAEAWRDIRLPCPALSLFADPPVALFLAVAPAPLLVQQHAALCDTLPRDMVHPHYRPGMWLPHVTVADDLLPNRVAAAMAVAQPVFRPFTAGFAQLDVLRFRPVKVLWHKPLNDAGDQQQQAAP